MCGIVGMAGNLQHLHRKVLIQLIQVDSIRGEDSTGAAFVNKFTGGVQIDKQVGDPFALLYSNKFNKLLDMNNKVVIGHNRWATSGDVNRINAHPFDFDTLVGVHNGTLGSKWNLDDNKDFKVDSENLYHNIEKNGLEDSISRLGYHNNAWSLVWWDKITSTLNFLRNKERPMYLCWGDTVNTLFWASEPWMLEGVLGRNNVKHHPVFLTQEDMHYSVHIDKDGVISKPVLKRVAAPIPPPTKVYQNSFTHTSTNTATNSPVGGGKVVEITSKKTEVVSKVNPAYVNSKNVLLEILSTNRDKDGSDYIQVFDPLEPYFSIRLYPRAEDNNLKHKVGTEIRADISSFVSAANNLSYYKVSPWTVKSVEKVEPEMFNTPNGGVLGMKQWQRVYGTCAFCSDMIDPSHGFKFTTQNECLCNDCSKNPEVTQYVNLK